MIEFEKPNIECLEVDDTNSYAKFVCEPLERGYGVTIGNSLRRILLSSLPGCAITGVKIEGVLQKIVYFRRKRIGYEKSIIHFSYYTLQYCMQKRSSFRTKSGIKRFYPNAHLGYIR